ncbi:hypothetical protein TIFTF001_034393 [Ficus carica]|uniref:Uncharacterized protein n=1 Tax=Ficus carica TaxID=3494 RepID=A0AA88E0F0_FICCA|nr:hypothetical protein TIFTF001_034393 [Ficus carica]
MSPTPPILSPPTTVPLSCLLFPSAHLYSLYPFSLRHELCPLSSVLCRSMRFGKGSASGGVTIDVEQQSENCDLWLPQSPRNHDVSLSHPRDLSIPDIGILRSPLPMRTSLCDLLSTATSSGEGNLQVEGSSTAETLNTSGARLTDSFN